MGGKVLELPSDKLREEREKGIEQGIEALIETCREFGLSKEDTQRKLQTKFESPTERIDSYMEKYWK